MKEATVLGSTLCKRILAIMLCVCILVMACGCDSIDYKKATKLYNNGEWDEAIEIFESLGSYEDSEDMINACNYEKATELYENKEYDEAIEIFESLGSYEDSEDMVNACNYEKATGLYENKDYDGAIEIFESLGSYEGSEEMVNACNYEKATELYKNKDYDGAIEIFESLGEYKDSTEQIAFCKLAQKLINIRNANVGDYVYFGSYEQDNDTTNGKEDIEWLVLDKQGSKVLLLSHYGLDAQPYNAEDVDTTWENCTLRTWLNETFINNAFSSAEQQNILLTDVDNSQSQCCSEWDTTGGNNTQDKVFLLSYAEANKYLDVTNEDAFNCTNTKSRVAPTKYAKSQGAYSTNNESIPELRDKTDDGLHAGFWWLRSPYDDLNFAAIVFSTGSLGGSIVDLDVICVRPSLWIDFEA